MVNYPVRNLKLIMLIVMRKGLNDKQISSLLKVSLSLFFGYPHTLAKTCVKQKNSIAQPPVHTRIMLFFPPFQNASIPKF